LGGLANWEVLWHLWKQDHPTNYLTEHELEALVSRMDISSPMFDRYNQALYAKQAVLEN